MPLRGSLGASGLALAIGLCAVSRLVAQGNGATPLEDFLRIYPNMAPPGVKLFEPSNPANEIAAALSLAKKDGKRVLLDFGADWCVDCRVLEPVFKLPEIAKVIEANFHLVRIDVGNWDTNPGAAKQYGIDPLKVGIPAIVLLDAQGRIIPPPNKVQWRMSRIYKPAEVLGFLQELAAAR